MQGLETCLGVDHLIFDGGVVQIPQKYRAYVSG